MIMKILIILLILSVVLLIITVCREKKQKKARYSNRGMIRKTSAVFKKERPSRDRMRQQEPTVSQLAPSSLIRNESQSQERDTHLYAKKSKQISSDHVNSLDKIKAEALENEQEFLQEELDSEDADTILGLKPRAAATVQQPEKKLNTINKTQVSPSPSISAALVARSSSTHADDQPGLLGSRAIIYLKASKERPYGGYDLLQTLLANHFRYGEMDIFHRNEQNTGEGRRLFSLAAATKTGTFDLTKIGSFVCQGLSLFYTVTEVQNPVYTYNLMLETAHQLVSELGGTLLDENQQEMTAEKLQLVRETLRNLSF